VKKGNNNIKSATIRVSNSHRKQINKTGKTILKTKFQISLSLLDEELSSPKDGHSLEQNNKNLDL